MPKQPIVANQGDPREPLPQNFQDILSFFAFERRCPKQKIVTRLKWKDLAPPKFWAGYAADCDCLFNSL